jgi:hypothetical protein
MLNDGSVRLLAGRRFETEESRAPERTNRLS